MPDHENTGSIPVAPPSPGQFIHTTVLPLYDGECRHALFVGQFRMASMTPSLFSMHAIDCPPPVARSVPKRQAEFLAGRICAKAALQAHGFGHHEVAIGRQREPVWPDGMVGSITHNGTYAAAVACPRADLVGIGIDIESIAAPDILAGMIDLVMSPTEAECLRASDCGLDAACLQTLVFSAKESFYKAAFGEVNAFFGFDAIELVGIDGARRQLHFRCTQTLSARLPRGRTCLAQFDFLDAGSVLTAIVLRR